MEFVALSDTVLRYLAKDDPELKRVFWDVVPLDGLPRHPSTTTRAAYIVNTDPAGEPGQHWLAVWTEPSRGCEVFDSYGLPLQTYPAPGLHEWLAQWIPLYRSDMTLQALQSQACGHYALLFLKARARGVSFDEFLANFSPHDLVANDAKVAQQIRALIKEELSEVDNAVPGRQGCVTFKENRRTLNVESHCWSIV